MNRLWIHIGAHKTGTTYVQEQFAEHEEAIATQGVLYPKTGREFLWGHHRLIRRIGDSASFDKTKRELADEMDGFKGDVFISSENFGYLTAEQMRKVASLFDARDIKVIYMYRNWTPLLYSSWQEHVKHGSIAHLHQYAFSNVVFYQKSRLLNFNLPIAKAEAAFGSGKVSIASYDTVRRQGDLVNFFFDLLGIPGVTPPAGVVKNMSLTPTVAEIVRVLNRLAARNKIENGSEMRKLFLKHLNRKSDPRIGKLLQIMQPYIEKFDDVSDSAIAREFSKRFVMRHAKKFVVPDDAQEISDADLPRFVGPDYLTDPAAAPALKALFDTISAKIGAAR